MIIASDCHRWLYPLNSFEFVALESSVGQAIATFQLATRLKICRRFGRPTVIPLCLAIVLDNRQHPFRLICDRTTKAIAPSPKL